MTTKIEKSYDTEEKKVEDFDDFFLDPPLNDEGVEEIKDPEKVVIDAIQEQLQTSLINSLIQLFQSEIVNMDYEYYGTGLVSPG